MKMPSIRFLKSLMITLTMGILVSGCDLNSYTADPSISNGYIGYENGFGTGFGNDGFDPNVPIGVEIEGKWRPVNEKTKNIYYNEFKEGRFAAYTADGRNTLALGSYIPTPTGAIIQYFSEAQRREVSSVCVFESRDDLSCTVENQLTIQLQRD